jgi:hypothetical protein
LAKPRLSLQIFGETKDRILIYARLFTVYTS